MGKVACRGFAHRSFARACPQTPAIESGTLRFGSAPA
jgi:hypothetical protein